MMTETNETEDINIETIMQEIRQQILAKKDAIGQTGNPLLHISGKRFSPQFYEHLYQAGMVYDRMGVKMEAAPINMPLIGPLLTNLRAKLHELVIFYVNKMADQQVQFNIHILQAVNALAQELEQEADQASE